MSVPMIADGMTGAQIAGQPWPRYVLCSCLVVAGVPWGRCRTTHPCST